MINVKEIINKSIAVSTDDAKKVQEEIKKLINKDEKIEVSFENITMLISHFLNVSIGELYPMYKDKWDILDNINFIAMNEGDLKILKDRVIPSFKEPPTNKERFKSIQEGILK